MGIRGLTATLRPFASQSQLRGRVVIDGPALAYHILHLCRVEAGVSTALDEPSYFALGSTTIRWLDSLQSCGIEVAAIYFDGHLPSFKQEERLERTSQTSKVSNNYFLATISGIPLGSGTEGDASKYGRQLPVPAFLVPAILDALRSSEVYGDLTHLVPWEADSLCADDVRRYGGTVLTSDSDLLLYDLGLAGSVVFLNGLDVGFTLSDQPSTKVVTASKYCQIQICDKLSLESGQQAILSVAFEIKMDPHRTLASWVSRSKRRHSATSYASQYEEFVSQYLDSPGLDVMIPGYMSFLDPRISEFISSWTGSAASGNSESRPESTENKVFYLPPLLDRWDQASAWSPSTWIRQLAYSFCPRRQDIGPTVVEYRRTLSKKSKGQNVELFHGLQVAEALRELLDLASKLIGAAAKPCQLQWATLSLSLEVFHAAEHGKESLAVKLWRKASKHEGRLDPGTWDVVHLAAQIQGTLYSLRILQQVLECQVGHLVSSPSLAGQVSKLRNHLSTLPSIAEFPCTRDMETMFERLLQAGRLESLADAAGLSGLITHGGHKKKPKRRKQLSSPGKGRAPKPALSTNIFDVLNIDN